MEGDPTEGVLYPFAAKLGMDRAAEAASTPRIDVIPFESEHKFMATPNHSADGEMLLVKGAPEVILDHCDRQQTERGPAPLDRHRFMREDDRPATQGERVLGLAWLPAPGLTAGSLRAEDLPENLILIGLVGLMDPPRKEAIAAVRECHGGGIRVTMITGDHKITAAVIARMLGIGDGKTAVSGTEIEAMDDAALQECVRDVDVFARASPEHKLRLMKTVVDHSGRHTTLYFQWPADPLPFVAAATNDGGRTLACEAEDMSIETWTVAEAKAKFSEVIEKACSDGPQAITKHGRTTAVVVSAKEWARKTHRPGNLAEFFAESPLRGSELKTPRVKDGPRKVAL